MVECMIRLVPVALVLQLLLTNIFTLYISPLSTDLHRESRCTKSECDDTKALSYCGDISKQCNAGHEEAPSGKCSIPNKRCCRTACHGPMSYCFAMGTECLQDHIATEGKCPVEGYRCCAPYNGTTLAT